MSRELLSFTKHDPGQLAVESIYTLAAMLFLLIARHLATTRRCSGQEGRSSREEDAGWSWAWPRSWCSSSQAGDLCQADPRPWQGEKHCQGFWRDGIGYAAANMSSPQHPAPI